MHSSQLTLRCLDLDNALEIFTRRLGFRLEMIMPADSPVVAVVSGHGIAVRLEQADGAAEFGDLIPGEDIAEQLIKLGGEWVEADKEKPVVVPPIKPELIITRASDSGWVKGRAGMEYRDLIPGRLGGAVVASHIRIPKGGPVPDYVHYHRVAFQMIYCLSGWVRVVYEDQGEPFVMNAGDCILQPPGIRHRVLECSDNFEVIEVSMPAVHETFVEHDMELPTGRVLPDRLYGGQKFVRHIASEAGWVDSGDGYEYQDFGIGEATGGLVDVNAKTFDSGAVINELAIGFIFCHVLSGNLALSCWDNPSWVETGGSYLLSSAYHLSTQFEKGVRLLEVKYKPNLHLG